MERVWLCLDIGTSSVKGGFLDSRGRLAAWARESYPGDVRHLYSDWDPRLWDRTVARVVASLRAQYEPALWAGVVISGNGPTVVPIGSDGEPLFRALLWADGSGCALSGQGSFVLPKIEWFRRTHPDVYEKTSLFLSCPEYLVFRMTGEAVQGVPCEEYARNFWDKPGLEAYGMDSSLFPFVVSLGEPAGLVSKLGSERFGIPEGIPVSSGGPDYLAALVGSGCVRPGTTCDRAGTSEGINHVVVGHQDVSSLRCLAHPVSGLYTLSGILSSTGRIFEWFRRLINRTDESYESLLKRIDQVWDSSLGPLFLPSSRRLDTWDFVDGAFWHLKPSHNSADLGRGVVQSIAFSIRSFLDEMAGAGFDVSVLRVSGGQARNRVWNQMKADVTGAVVEVPRVVDAELVGGLVFALASQEALSLEEAADRAVRIEHRFVPRRERKSVYDDAYEYYSEACEKFWAGAALKKDI